MQLLTKKDLCPYDDDIYHIRDCFPVFQEFIIDDYRHGRCHLMAMVMARELSMSMGVILDYHAFEDGNGAPISALQHAYCHAPDAKGYLVDGKGLIHPEEMRDEYATMAWAPGELEGQEAMDLIVEWMACGKLEAFLPGEEEALQRFVARMQALNLFRHENFVAEPDNQSALTL